VIAGPFDTEALPWNGSTMTSQLTVADWAADATATISGLGLGYVEHPLTR
jgi:hypothetical protein